MPEKDQEWVEDYLELERYITSLQAEQTTHLPDRLTPRQARIYRMVLLFSTFSHEGTEPHPAFVESLQARLEREHRQSLARSPFLLAERKVGRKVTRTSNPSFVSLIAVISSPSGSGKNGVVGIPCHLSSELMRKV